ncbi:MAG: helix-hairpin-helix domain-containing protein [Mediterranea sp.]|jgi:hypothetical protein|nr:helix-hairpin-helix domain-containing protein [Mediterranea sp.]
MNEMKTGILTLFFLSMPVLFLSAQHTVEPDLGEEVLEQLTENNEDEVYSWENEIEDLYDLIREPLNLNAATKEQLEQFSFLSELQIENILAYLYINGQMKTIYELQTVEEMDKKTIELLLSFVCVQPVAEKEPLPSIKDIFSYGKNEVLTRVDIPFYRRNGYSTSYLGPPLYNSLRYGFRYKDRIYAGITAEKDAGEPAFALHNAKGYDYYSFYFYLRNFRKLKTLAVGNYRLSFGQGLVVSNDFMLGKSTTIFSMITRKNSIRKHSSTDEYNYFRGAAGAVQLDRFVLSTFYSHRSLDGISTGESITSIHKTGLHRTQKEAERKEVFAIQLTGGNIEYNAKRLRLGVTGIYYFFDRPYLPAIRDYSKYNIRGNYFHNTGVNYKYSRQHFTFLGEAALDKSGRLATLNAVNYSFKQAYRIVLLHRYYAHNYWNLFARSFSESGYIQNENGWYAAVETHPIRYWTFFLSADFFSFPWWKYLVDAPSTGYDLSTKVTFEPKENMRMYIRYRYKKKEKNYTDEYKQKTVRPLYQHRLRYQFVYTWPANISLRSTIDYNRIYPQDAAFSQGIHLAQAISHSFSTLPLRIELQGSLFKTDDYASRVYSSEKGLLYTFYSPSFYGKGTRLATFLRYDLNRHWMLIVKYGQTTYFDREKIGSGDDLIKGNKKCDLQLQLRVKC